MMVCGDSAAARNGHRHEHGHAFELPPPLDRPSRYCKFWARVDGLEGKHVAADCNAVRPDEQKPHVRGHLEKQAWSAP
jgi:hypothetical protein